MKAVLKKFSFPLLVMLTACIAFAFKHKGEEKNDINGAWHLQNDGEKEVLLFSDGYFSHTSYSIAKKTFIQTNGGPFEVTGEVLTILKEFDTGERELVGQQMKYTIAITDGQLTMDRGGKKTIWKRLDDGKDNLAGAWKITARKQNGIITQIHQMGTRKTVKILTGTRFQWAAINPGTKEFSGTGGGTYTFKDGKYTENIEFFSRDSSRVGASLSFDGKLENGEWHHSGKSSKGDDIYEVWGRVAGK